MSPDGQQAVAASTRAPVLDIDTPVSLSKTLPPGSTIMAANQLDDYYANPQPFLDAPRRLLAGLTGARMSLPTANSLGIVRRYASRQASRTSS